MHGTQLLDAGVGSGVDAGRSRASAPFLRQIDVQTAAARFGARSVDGSEFALVLGERVIGDVVLYSGGGGVMEFVAPDAPGEVVDLVFVESGELAITSGPVLAGSSTKRVRGGALVVAPSWLGVRARAGTAWSALALRIDRATVEAFAPRIPDDVGVFESRSALEKAVRIFVFELLRSGAGDDTQSELERYATEQLLTEMAGSVLLDRYARGWSSAPPSAALRDRAIAVISQSRADPNLTPEAVARAVQSSLRRVQAAFAEVDNSVAAEIRRQRARLAKSLLSNSRYDVLGVNEVAEQSGFGTVTSMRRALIDAYGVGPRELRANRGRAHPRG